MFKWLTCTWSVNANGQTAMRENRKLFPNSRVPQHQTSKSQLQESMDQPWWPLWPGHQSHLTWGHMKQLVYETVVKTEYHLIARIIVVAGTIVDMPEIFEQT